MENRNWRNGSTNPATFLQSPLYPMMVLLTPTVRLSASLNLQECHDKQTQTSFSPNSPRILNRVRLPIVTITLTEHIFQNMLYCPLCCPHEGQLRLDLSFTLSESALVYLGKLNKLRSDILLKTATL